MDAARFDAVSRAIAQRSSRRAALRRLGGGGLLASLLGVAGLDRAIAQADELVTCRLTLSAVVAVGPSEDDEFDGDLTLVLDPDGAIDEGELRTEGGDRYEVVGQAIGRSLDLRIEVGRNRALTLAGVGENDILLCRGRIDGTFGGPREGDLGTWSARARSNLGQSTQPTPMPGGSGGNTGGTSGSSGGSSGSGGSGGSGGGPTPTPCPQIDCGGTFVLDPATCQCVCPPPYDRCGDVCCFGGSICDAASQSCYCPQGMEPCNEVCTPSCPAGQYLDYTTCQCTADAACGAGQTLCNGQCVSLSCPAHQLFDASVCGCVNRCSAGQGYCNGQCIDIVNDRNNCGSCGNQCATGVPCIAGVCTCPPGYKLCPGTGCKPESSTC